MSDQRTHYVTTTDGVTIGGTVHGQGPPLVFLHGAIGDGDLDWRALVPHLTDRYTCHLPSTRGRGLSGDHPDISPGRTVDDVIAYVDSIGKVTGLVGWGAGAIMALAVAARRSDAVDAVAPVEVPVRSVWDEQHLAAIGDTLRHMGELVAEGRLTDAARAFGGFVMKDEEIAVLDDAGYFEATGRYVPNLLEGFEQQGSSQGPDPTAPDVLGTISAPVLVVHGSDTKPVWTRGAQHVADHVPNARMHEIPGAGLASPLLHPEALAEALTEFFQPAEQPV